MSMQARVTPSTSSTIPLVAEKPLVDKTHNPVTLKCVSQTHSIQCVHCSLKKFCLAKSITPQSMQALNDITHHPKPMQKGEHFFRQEDPFEAIYIVHSGAIKTYHLDENGDEQVTGFYLPGELLGMDGFVSNQHKFSAQALNTTTVCAINFKPFEKLLPKHPDLQRRIMEILCLEIQDKQQPLLLLRHKPAENLLATFLVDISKRLNARGLSANEFNLPMARCDIASYLGLAGETMSRLFTRFQKMKLLSSKGRTVIIYDLPALKAMAIN